MNSADAKVPAPAIEMESARNSGRMKAAVLLVLANVCWGWSFPTMKWVVPEMQRLAPSATRLAVTSTFIGWRFGIATLLYLGINIFQQRGYTRADVLGGI